MVRIVPCFLFSLCECLLWKGFLSEKAKLSSGRLFLLELWQAYSFYTVLEPVVKVWVLRAWNMCEYVLQPRPE